MVIELEEKGVIMKKILSVLLVCVLVVTMASCTFPEVSVVGTWKHTSTVLGVVTESTYTFNEDGTGKISGVLDVDFTYAFSKEELFITTSPLGIEITEKYTFEFKEDKLILTNGKTTLELVKVKEQSAY